MLPQIYQKKCSYHANNYLTYLQIGQKKQNQIGACYECITSNDLSGENLILIKDILNISQDNPISKKYPFLQDKKLVSNILSEYISQEYKDPLKETLTFLGQLKDKVINSIVNIEKSIQQNPQQYFVNKEDLLNSYQEISQKGKFLDFFKDYILESGDQGQDFKISH
ncbi:ADP-ribosylation factor family protein, putative (macronuclear) [Tetrahymena thermophila SB210]|uniref:ADP-ribosylation factor family protein, putative n=1 Tax=Tetrahymena thermophila (strain SB210) TaxID=312017 RepID=Q22AY6_TETTS|nr:ADP-ribosylation factor family protein, putative [Tetrahymena thermophila SB210]EAR82472.2 ADP-ribosylation factor family protein, putative [Tetrahymena thermophila SB210]|eukprot:XP_001030135.2 ADP-ribosylation factor family protein, putative [Tetrahymena thermophila SB210]